VVLEVWCGGGEEVGGGCARRHGKKKLTMEASQRPRGRGSKAFGLKKNGSANFRRPSTCKGGKGEDLVGGKGISPTTIRASKKFQNSSPY